MALDFPNSPSTGQVYSYGLRSWQWNGRSWIAYTTTLGYTGSIGYSGSSGAGYTGSSATYTTSTSPPSSPVYGDRWFDTTTGCEFVWTNDGDSSQWVEIAASGFLGQLGYTGSIGFTGSASTVVGYTGSIGSPGGYIGSQGIQGYTGSAGLNTIVVALSDEVNALTAGSPKLTIRAPTAMTLTSAPRAMLTTASSSGTVTVDMLVSGSSILNTKLVLASGVTTTYSSPATLLTTPTSISEDAVITFNVTSAGTNAAGLKVTVYFS